MLKGNKVVAAVRFEEDEFDEGGTHVHAEPGDAGEVEDVFEDGGLMIRWERTGTACDALPGELVIAITPAAQRETISA